MSKPAIAAVLSFLLCLVHTAYALEDGTVEVTPPAEISIGHSPNPVEQATGMVVLNPIESVSISTSSTWPDNRHRAYYNTGTGHVNGFLLFDVSSVPDGSTITAMSLLCYLENAFGSPFSNPLVDVYYSADDGWTRASATPGSLSLDVLLVDDVPFTVYVPTYNFVIDVGAHDWSGDLVDDQICIGFTNPNNFYSYVYFFGAGGSPQGPAPELTIEYESATPVEASTWGNIKALFD